MSQQAEYCAQCPYFFNKMGACPHPDKTMIYAYLSLLPYLIPWFLSIAVLIWRRISHFKVVTMLVSGYIFGDKVLKNLIRSPRPLFACKKSFGFPSSHMFVMVSIAFYRATQSGVSWAERAFWLALVILQGIARVELNYHTITQVIAGTITGVLYTLAYNWAWQKAMVHVKDSRIVRWATRKINDYESVVI